MKTFPTFAAITSLLWTSTLPAAEPALRPWNEYRTIMWIGDTAYKKPEKLPLFFQRLREMGINAGMVTGDASAQPLLDAKMPFYVENIVNRGLCLKWSSKVNDWDKMVTAWKTPRDEAGLVRDYSFDDPKWREWARGAMTNAVRKHAPNNPLAYDIRDELSTTISANPFDYDFSPTALAGFRDWLKTQYADLAALNAEWDTHFAKWEDVKPFTTDQIKNRMAGADADALGFPKGKPDWQAVQAIKFDPIEARKNPARWNFAPWCDHRTYMDISLARTLGDLRETARALDPRTPVGIEGTQMPSAFGGYDLWRLSQVLDWVEPYDVGNAREIFGSFMPGKTFLTTVGEQDAKAARRRLWHLLLEGDKGCIVWWSEDCIDWKSDDYTLTPRSKSLAPVLKEMQSPLAHLFLRAKREIDPVAIHYSQASIQVNWLLESTEDGSTWLRRFSSYEASHNKMAKSRQAWVKLLQDLGYTPQFLSTEQIERGALATQKILVCPDSLAMSAAEEAAISKWIDLLPGQRENRIALGSDEPNHFDPHGRLRATGHLSIMGDRIIHRDSTWYVQLFPESLAVGVLGDAPLSSLRRRDGRPTNVVEAVAQHLPQDEIDRRRAASLEDGLEERLHEILRSEIQVPRDLCVRTHRYYAGSTRLIAFERNIVWQMSEDLKQSGENEALEKPVSFDAKLATPSHVYDLRTGKYLGLVEKIPVDLDPWQPSLYALTKAKLPDGDVIAELEKLASQ